MAGMTTPQKRGRPGKGPRDGFYFRPSVNDGKVVRLISDKTDQTFQDVLDWLLKDALSRVDLEKILDQANRQEALPIPKAS